MKKEIPSILKITLLATVLSFGISYALAWTAPTATPPVGNVFAPINVGPGIQTKAVGGDFCVEKTAGSKKCLSDSQLAFPVTNITATPSTIQNGATTTISWNVADATSCTTGAGPWVTPGTKLLVGSEVSNPLSGVGGPITYSYSLSCTGPGGTILQTATVQVLAPATFTYTNGTGALIAIPSGVTVVKFRAQGGNGGNGGGTTPAGSGGGDASFAYYGANVPIVVAGGGGGGPPLRAGGPGGYTGTSIHGGFGPSNWLACGPLPTAGNTVSGGSSGGCTASYLPVAGGANATRSDGVTPSSGRSATGDMTAGAFGGKGFINGGKGGTNGGSLYSGGGGGGLGGGGGGIPYGVGGGGGSGYIITGATGPDASGFIAVPLSLIGNPTSIYLFGGAGGVPGNGGSTGVAGFITMSW